MRTTLDIDDALMEALLGRIPDVSKTEAIERAIRTFLADDAANKLRSMAGHVQIDDVSQAMRQRDRSS